MTICKGTTFRSEPGDSSYCGCGKLPGVQRETLGERANFAADFSQNVFIGDIIENPGNQSGYVAHFRLAEAAGGHGRASEAHATGIEGRVPANSCRAFFLVGPSPCHTPPPPLLPPAPSDS